jgi:hypothetical protein
MSSVGAIYLLQNIIKDDQRNIVERSVPAFGRGTAPIKLNQGYIAYNKKILPKPQTRNFELKT